MKTPLSPTKGLIGCLIAVATLCLCGPAARAQTDFYGAQRAMVLLQTNLVSTTTFTSLPLDVHGYAGVGNAQLYWTDTAGNTNSTLWARIEGSSDKTNYTALSNASVAILTSINRVNLSLGGLTVTNSTWVPGTLTTATPATAGFAGTYLVPAAFTSLSVLLTNSVATGAACLGLDMESLPRYIRVTGGTTTNINGSITVIVTGRKENGQW